MWEMKSEIGNWKSKIRKYKLMNKLIVVAFVIVISLFARGQDINKIITSKEVERIGRILSADEMMGRKTFSPQIDKAADFIAEEFKKNGLRYYTGLTSYLQPFSMIKAKLISAEGNFEGKTLDPKNITAFTTQPGLSINNNSGYEKVNITATENFFGKAFKYIESDKNYLIIVDTAHSANFKIFYDYEKQSFKKNNSVILVLSTVDPSVYQLNILYEVTEPKLANVIGILPGKSKKDEYVIFSAHYDHIGTGKPDTAGDSIYNGANDDAAGTTAVVMLSKYFKKLNNNERTLIFVAFTAEEIGGYGSKYFSKNTDADKVVAMFNIEMIGTESMWGTNSAYITGYEKSDLGKILQSNLTGSKFHFEPDPYPTENLFYRSDNATLAALGVPAHTISTSKMDAEKFYHTREDEIESLDINNMTEIIKAVALSSKSLINGNDTPGRIKSQSIIRY